MTQHLEPWFHYSTQNMNKGVFTPAGAHGPLWKHGRAHAWFRLTKKQRLGTQEPFCFGLAWHFGGGGLAATIRVHDHWASDDDITAHLALPGLSLHFSAEDILPRKRYRLKDDRELGFHWHHQILWLKLWCSDNWSKQAPFWKPESHWRQPALHVVDWVLGKIVRCGWIVAVQDLVLVLPDGQYPVTIELLEDVWWRPRWPGMRHRRRASCCFDIPVPVPGRYDNDIEQGKPQAIQDITLVAGGFDDALVKLREHIEKARSER